MLKKVPIKVKISITIFMIIYKSIRQWGPDTAVKENIISYYNNVRASYYLINFKNRQKLN